jgi:hypothetical protein
MQPLTKFGRGDTLEFMALAIGVQRCWFSSVIPHPVPATSVPWICQPMADKDTSRSLSTSLLCSKLQCCDVLAVSAQRLPAPRPFSAPASAGQKFEPMSIRHHRPVQREKSASFCCRLLLLRDIGFTVGECDIANTHYSMIARYYPADSSKAGGQTVKASASETVRGLQRQLR